MTFNKEPLLNHQTTCRWVLEYADYIPAEKYDPHPQKRSVLIWHYTSEECVAPFYRHYFQVHSNPQCKYLLEFYLWVK